MFDHHLAALPIIVPLIAAPIAFILGRSFLCWLLTTLVSGAAFIISWQLLVQALSEGVLSYAVGGWQPPWGIELRVDAVNAFVLLAVTAASTLVLIYSKDSIEKEISPGHQRRLHCRRA